MGDAARHHAGHGSNYYANLALLPEQGDALVVLTARHALFEDKAAPMNGALDILTGGGPQAISRGFVLANVRVAAVGLALLIVMVIATVRLVRMVRGPGDRVVVRGTARAVLWSGLGSLTAAALSYLAVCLGLGAAMGSGGVMPLATAFAYAPDITAVVLAVIGFLTARGAAVLIVGFARRRHLAH